MKKVVSFAAATAAALFLSITASASEGRPIELTFTPETIEPNEITMKAGEKVLFIIKNTDDEGDHNFLSADAELPEILVGPEKTVQYSWTAPTTPGTYGAMCTIHPWIKMTFVVE